MRFIIFRQGRFVVCAFQDDGRDVLRELRESIGPFSSVKSTIKSTVSAFKSSTKLRSTIACVPFIAVNVDLFQRLRLQKIRGQRLGLSSRVSGE